MKKKLRWLCGLLVAILLLSACGGMTREELHDLLGQSAAGSGRDQVIPFEEMKYERPNLSAMQARAQKVESMLQNGSSYDLEAVIEAVDACTKDYFTFYTMYVLAEIHSYADMEDEAWAEEFAYCDGATTQVEQMVDLIYINCAQSEWAEMLEKEYFGEGFIDQYGGDYTGYTDNTYAALVQEENELIGRYRQLRAGLTVDYRGEEASFYDLTADPTLTEEEYSEVMASYYEKYTPQFGEIYLELIQVRNEIAEYFGYDNYAEYAYEQIYGRNYTVEESEALIEDIRKDLVPVYEKLTESGAWGDVFYGSVGEETLETCLSAAAEAMGGQVGETWSFLEENHLYDIRVSPQKVNNSFQVYLEDYEAPYAFIKTFGTTEDVLTFAHEFGHCVDAYVNYNDTYSLELMETYSQGMEYLLLCYLEDTVSGAELENLTAMKLLDTLDTYVQQASFADFELQAYALPEEERTVEKLNKISLETAKEYGYFVEGYEDYYAMSWIDILHFFEQPCYVISYCVSNDAAFQIYEMEKEEQGAGLAAYNHILQWESDDFLLTIEDLGNLESPFAPGRMASTAATVEQFFQS